MHASMISQLLAQQTRQHVLQKRHKSWPAKGMKQEQPPPKPGDSLLCHLAPHVMQDLAASLRRPALLGRPGMRMHLIKHSPSCRQPRLVAYFLAFMSRLQKRACNLTCKGAQSAPH